MDADSTMAEVIARRSQVGRSKTGPLPFVLVGLACTVVGCLVGSIFIGGSAAASAPRSDGAIASFSRQGETREVGPEDVRKAGIGYFMQEDGGFASIDVLNAVRMGVLSQEARNQGISVTDEEVSSYAKSQYGTDDYSSLGEGLLDAEAVKEAFEQRLLVDRLRAERVSDGSAQQPPASPTAPDGGPEAESVLSAEYGTYLIGLFGEAYDVQTDSWVQLDSPFYETFKDESFSASGATFEQAMKAYHVAYSLYDASSSDARDSWTGYVNEMMSDVEVVLYGVAL